MLVPVNGSPWVIRAETQERVLINIDVTTVNVRIDVMRANMAQSPQHWINTDREKTYEMQRFVDPIPSRDNSVGRVMPDTKSDKKT